ncbi:MAG: aldo/keto reductase [Ornithinimicrobium sp.]
MLEPRRSDAPHHRIGVGLAALGRPAYLTSGRAQDLGEQRSVEDLQERTVRVLDAAYAGGVRYLDAARSYGRAEEFLAHWLRSRPEVDDVMVASKWGYRYVGDWRRVADEHEIKDHSVAALRRQVEESTAILGDRLSIYQVHSLTGESPVLHDTQAQQILAGMRDEGLRVGFSTSGPGQADTIRAATRIEVGGMPLFSVVQSTWNLLEPSAGPALAEAARAGLSVVVKESVANGRLTPSQPPDSPTVERAVSWADRLGVALDQLAMAAALSNPWVDRVLSGAVTVWQVESHLGALQVELPPEVLEDLVAEEPVGYWDRRSRRSWS